MYVKPKIPTLDEEEIERVVNPNWLIDLIEMKIIIPSRKLLREAIGRPDINMINEKIYVGSYPTLSRSAKKFLAFPESTLLIDLRSSSEAARRTLELETQSIPLKDGSFISDADLAKLVQKIQIDSPEKIILLCRQGRNRSVNLAIALLMKLYSYSLKSAICELSSKRKFIRITREQMSKLLELELGK